MIAVVLFVEVDDEFFQVQRFASTRFGEGTVYAAPTKVVFASARRLGPGERPVVERPTFLGNATARP